MQYWLQHTNYFKNILNEYCINFNESTYKLTFNNLSYVVLLSQEPELWVDINKTVITINIDKFNTNPKFTTYQLLKKMHVLPKIMARKCIVNRCSKPDLLPFFNDNHYLGYINGYFKYALIHEGKIQMAAVFSKAKIINGIKSFQLIGVCSNIHLIVTGGLDKLIKHFVIQHKADHLMTYIDTNYFTGEAFIKLGFKPEENIKNKPQNWLKLNLWLNQK